MASHKARGMHPRILDLKSCPHGTFGQTRSQNFANKRDRDSEGKFSMFFNPNASLSLSSKLLYGASMGALLVANPAMAQSVASAPAVEQVTVTATTGTLIKGVAPVGAPIETYDLSEI